jgi:hypothetical protein
LNKINDFFGSQFFIDFNHTTKQNTNFMSIFMAFQTKVFDWTYIISLLIKNKRGLLYFLYIIHPQLWHKKIHKNYQVSTKGIKFHVYKKMFWIWKFCFVRKTINLFGFVYNFFKGKNEWCYHSTIKLLSLDLINRLWGWNSFFNSSRRWKELDFKTNIK